MITIEDDEREELQERLVSDSGFNVEVPEHVDDTPDPGLFIVLIDGSAWSASSVSRAEFSSSKESAAWVFLARMSARTVVSRATARRKWNNSKAARTRQASNKTAAQVVRITSVSLRLMGRFSSQFTLLASFWGGDDLSQTEQL